MLVTIAIVERRSDRSSPVCLHSAGVNVYWTCRKSPLLGDCWYKARCIERSNQLICTDFSYIGRLTGVSLNVYVDNGIVRHDIQLAGGDGRDVRLKCSWRHNTKCWWPVNTERRRVDASP